MMTRHKTSDFDYKLPKGLIAQVPLPTRSASRLLMVNHSIGAMEDASFERFVDFLDKGDLLVCNNTRVIPARLFGVKETGGKIECLVERVVTFSRVLAHIKASKSLRPGQRVSFAHGAITATVIERQGALTLLEFSSAGGALDALAAYGEMPLPPYIERTPDSLDQTRYQSVFAQKDGAVAAPTASLHMDEAMMGAIKEKGIDIAYVTLHVGAGTFQPVRTESLQDHVMHQESVDVPESVCEQVRACKVRGGRVIALGTTVVRSLETAAQSGELLPFKGETRLFITPGYSFRVVDALLTNFHLPQSTLLMLVCALGGHELIMRAYAHAIVEAYRFFSYGDAMLVYQD